MKRTCHHICGSGAYPVCFVIPVLKPNTCGFELRTTIGNNTANISPQLCVEHTEHHWCLIFCLKQLPILLPLYRYQLVPGCIHHRAQQRFTGTRVVPAHQALAAGVVGVVHSLPQRQHPTRNCGQQHTATAVGVCCRAKVDRHDPRTCVASTWRDVDAEYGCDVHV